MEKFSMLGNYVIRAVIDAVSTKPAESVRDRFNCGVNDDSYHYPTADSALMAAQAAYKGPDADGEKCKVWAERTAEEHSASRP